MRATILQKVKIEVKSTEQAKEMWSRALKGYLLDKITLEQAFEVGCYLKEKFKIKLFA